jgi:hypothetical protein
VSLWVPWYVWHALGGARRDGRLDCVFPSSFPSRFYSMALLVRDVHVSFCQPAANPRRPHPITVEFCCAKSSNSEVQGARVMACCLCVSSAALTCRASCSCALVTLLLCTCNVAVTMCPAHHLSRDRSVRETLRVVSFRACGSGHTARRPIQLHVRPQLLLYACQLALPTQRLTRTAARPALCICLQKTLLGVDTARHSLPSTLRQPTHSRTRARRSS